ALAGEAAVHRTEYIQISVALELVRLRLVLVSGGECLLEYCSEIRPRPGPPCNQLLHLAPGQPTVVEPLPAGHWRLPRHGGRAGSMVEVVSLAAVWREEWEIQRTGVGLLRLGGDREAELPAHRQHGGILAQHLAFDRLEALGTGVLDDLLHEEPAERAPF